jgi:hypothetical protein
VARGIITSTLHYLCTKATSDSAHQLDQPLATTHHLPPSSITTFSKQQPLDLNTRKHQPSDDNQTTTSANMCTFTPYLFPNCRCPQITTGPLNLCLFATRTGEKCPRPNRELLQKRPGTCGPCKQAQVAREKAKAEAEAKARAGREDSLVDAASGSGADTGAGLARSASKSSVGGKGRRKSGSAKSAGESKRVTRSGAKATLPTR